MAVVQSQTLVAFLLDVKTAFASVIRALAVPMGSSAGVYFQKLTSLGFTKDEAVDLFHRAQDPGKFIRSYGSTRAALVIGSL
eukprot:7086651-Karenia_brevis.AAC.1